MRTTRKTALFLALLAIPLPAIAGGYLGMGVGPRSGPLFTGDIGYTLCAGYVYNSQSHVALGIGIARNGSQHNFSEFSHGRTGIPDWAKTSETVIRPEVLFHPANASRDQGFYLGAGPSAARRKITLEKWPMGTGGGGVTFTGNDSWTKLLDGMSDRPGTPGSSFDIKDNVMGWHARVGVRFSTLVMLELLHEQAFDPAEDLGGTSLQIGLAW